MFVENLRCSIGRRTRLVCAGAAFIATASLLTTAHARPVCEDLPTCEIIDAENHYGVQTLIIPECLRDCPTTAFCGVAPTFCAWVDLPCPGNRQMRVILKGKRPNTDGGFVEIERVDRTDKDQRQKVFFQLPESYCVFPGGTTLEFRFIVEDLETGETTDCRFNIEIVCGQLPDCDVEGAYEGEIIDVRTGDILPVFEICAESNCDDRARVELFARPPFMQPIGHRKGSRGEKVCIETKANDVVEGGFAEGTYWAKFRCTDVTSGRNRVLKVGFRYTDPVIEEETCDDPPVCEVFKTGGILISGPMSTVTVPVGDSMTLIVCGSSACDDCDVTIAVTGAGLPFVSLSAAGVPGPDGFVGTCDEYVASPTVNDAAGIHDASFTVTDCNGATTECVVRINVFHPTPVLACTEDEEINPNDTFADAMVIDSGECIDESGVSIQGVLDTPQFMNGDVDYFRFVGLTPNAAYTATILAGMNGDNAFTDTMIGWLAADGIVVASDDNSGPRSVYSKVEFTADESGVATLAITGHGDDNFDGMMSGAMAYEEYGFGGYMLSIRGLADVGEMPLERQADLNGDGVVDTADLGVLIGLFGTTN